MASSAGRRRSARLRFNGATAVRPWMAAQARSRLRRWCWLQWGHGREAMDGGGKDAETTQAEKLQWGHGREAMDGRPSGFWRTARDDCFNGATAVRPWMAFGRRGYFSSSIGFNGATAVRPWMAGYDDYEIARLLGLQWGHGREAMDGSWSGRPLWLARLLQWGHGREAMDGAVSALRFVRIVGFNGATAVRPWMDTRRLYRHYRLRASMGPRP